MKTNLSSNLEFAALKRELSTFETRPTEWSFEDKLFVKRLEELPFDCQIIQCLNSGDFNKVKGLEAAFGHSSKNFNLDRFYDLVHKEDVIEVIGTDLELIRWMKRAVNGSLKKTLLSANFRFMDKSGGYRELQRNTFVLKLDDLGRASCLYHTLVDVSNASRGKNVKYRLHYPGCYMDEDTKQVKPEFDLTKREQEILTLIVEGYSSEEIGKKLFISKETVYRHRKNMIRKSKAKDTKDLAMQAITDNWI